MNSQHFLILNAVVLLVLIIWFLTGRRAGRAKPTQLRMKAGNQAETKAGQKTELKTTLKAESKNVESVASGNTGRYSDPKFQRFLDEDLAKRSAPVKELNVLFNYNGHSWDAYEVLGVPAGSNIVVVTNAYQDLIKKCSPESREFLETAFKTILAKS